jgi:hypothetical protein
MKFEEVDNKAVDSLILSLEKLSTEYDTTLNMYNQVQQELNTFANSEWQVNPYLNTNIQFTTGEIAYVTNSGSVFLYGFLPELYNTITTDQSYVQQQQYVVNQDQGIVNQEQNVFNQEQNTVNTTQDAAIGLGIASALVPSLLPGFIAAEVVLSMDESQLSADQSQLSSDQSQLSGAQSQLNADQNALNIAQANLLNALGQLNESGCPSTINNLVQVGLPWLTEYNEPYSLIPTTPPLLTMGQFIYQNGSTGYNGNIGFMATYGSGTGPVNGGCDAINAALTPPPYDIIAIPNSSYNATQSSQLQNTNIEICRAYCSVSPYCSGANFNTSTKTCTLMTGSGTLSVEQNTIALVPQVTQYLLQLSQLNFKLTQLNDQIVALIKTGEVDFNKDTNDNEIENKRLINRYKKLMLERERIDAMITKIGDAQQEEYSGVNFASNVYLKYGLLIALVIIIFIVLANINRSTEHMNSDGTMQKSLLFTIFVIVFVVGGIVLIKNLVSSSPSN